MSNEYKSEVGNTQGGALKSPVFMVLLALVVAAGGFGVWKLTKAEDNRPPVRIESATAMKAAETSTNQEPSPEPKQEIAQSEGTATGQFVASKNGKKYFTLTCSAAKTIKAENRIYFSSEDEAKKAGYEPSATCKDLN